MQSSIYLALAFVAFTAAKQLKVGPQLFSEPQISSSSNQKQDKRYVSQEFTLYLTPDEIKALQEAKNSERSEEISSPKESENKEQNEEEQQQKWYNQFLPESPQLEIRGLATLHDDAYFQKQKSESEIQKGNYEFVNYYSEEKPKEQEAKNEPFENFYWQKELESKSQQESDLQSDIKWKPYNPESTKDQEDILLNEQLKQQWNRILDHNRVQLKSLEPKEKQNSQEPKQKEKQQTNSKSEIEKEIENILKSQGAQGVEFNQRPPIIIHKEVSVTKHLPVPVFKKVKVAVPTPVLVPVPEPYEVKIPHPYPVPYHIVKHIPVPVISH